jgi:hypothetical protein
MSNFFELIDSMDLNHTDSEIRETLKDMYEKSVKNYESMSKTFNSVYEEREKLRKENERLSALEEGFKEAYTNASKFSGAIEYLQKSNDILYSLVNRFMAMQEKKNESN